MKYGEKEIREFKIDAPEKLVGPTGHKNPYTINRTAGVMCRWSPIGLSRTSLPFA